MFDGFFEDKIWEIKEHNFWTGPEDFSKMESEASDLYKELTEYSLIIFKVYYLLKLIWYFIKLLRE